MFSFDVVNMEEKEDEDMLFWYKCARFCYTCKLVQENYNDVFNLPPSSDLVHIKI